MKQQKQTRKYINKTDLVKNVYVPFQPSSEVSFSRKRKSVGGNLGGYNLPGYLLQIASSYILIGLTLCSSMLTTTRLDPVTARTKCCRLCATKSPSRGYNEGVRLFRAAPRFPNSAPLGPDLNGLDMMYVELNGLHVGSRWADTREADTV